MKAELGAVRWQCVNDEPFEYAIQQGPYGDEFVKLLDGSCLRRSAATPDVRAETNNHDLLRRLRDYLSINRRPGNDLNPKFCDEISRALANQDAPTVINPANHEQTK